MAGGEGQVGVHMFLRYIETHIKLGLHSEVYGIIFSGRTVCISKSA